MTTNRPGKSTPGWLPYAGFALAVCGMIYQAGGLAGRVDRNAERIAVLEARIEEARSKQDAMNERGARIETKLDYLTTSKGAPR
jgi:hypothetical protein